uniref:Uncharacterized protein n=1 Tax=Oryza brachyantha TaxID=4533 RepID=J3N173_ORYBR
MAFRLCPYTVLAGVAAAPYTSASKSTSVIKEAYTSRVTVHQNRKTFPYIWKWIVRQDLFAAGSDTSSSTVEWAMSELLQSPLSMAKVCDELQRVLGSRRRIEESEISQLPYLQAVIKETFRLHPPVPFLLPRQATKTIQILGYIIPKGARVLINVWAMGRDEDIWPEAMKFMPERFLHKTIEFKGGDLELIPFGAGRRICPGLPLAVRMVHVVLASLLINFKWKLPAEVEGNKIDMTEKFGVTLAKAIHLCAMATPT